MPTTSNFGWTTPADTDLVKDGAAAIRTLGNGIDTSFLDLKGGTTGQVLSKASNTDLDFSWIAVDPLTILDAKGDLISATAADTPARLAVGTNGQVLTADSTTSTGLKWATVAAGGKVLQVVYGSTTTVTSIGTSAFADTSLSASITPSSASSKVLILVSQQAVNSRSGNDIGYTYKLLRGATDIFTMGSNAYYLAATSAAGTLMQAGVFSLNYLDSPSTTSATTYKTQGKAYLGNVTFQDSGAGGSNISTMILLEIGA